MKALVYHGSRDVRVETVPDPVLEAPDDVILRVTATAICGSDLHLYRGRMPGLRAGDVLGHEFMGIVEDIGPAVTHVQRGDRVVVPFTISCGHCFFCERELYAACETTNPDRGANVHARNIRSGAGMFGYTHLYGGYAGGQAQFVRVPCANTGPLKLPEGLQDEQVLFLSDILPTGYQAVLNAGVDPGCSLAVFGAGPVGLMALACARMLGVERLYVVDRDPERLDFAARIYGAAPVNAAQIDDPAEYLIEATDYRGVDASIDAVGYEAKGSALERTLTALHVEDSSGSVLRMAIAATRRGGTLSIAGVYAGVLHGVPLGDAFDKGLSLRMGQTHVQRYMPELLRRIRQGELDPQVIISHRLPLAQAAHGYALFDTAQDGCRKVVLSAHDA